MASRKSVVNLVPLLDIILIFLLVFMLTADAETSKKAEMYDVANNERDRALALQREYIEKYDKLFVESGKALKDKENEIEELKEEYEKKVGRLQNDKADLLASASSLSDEAAMSKALASSLNEAIVQREKAEREKTLLERRNKTFARDLKTAWAEKDKLDSEIYKLKMNLGEMLRNLDDEKNENERLRSENHQLVDEREKNKKLVDEYNNLNESHKNLQKENNRLEAKEKELENDLSALEQSNKNLKVEMAKLETEKEVLAGRNKFYKDHAASPDYAEIATSLNMQVESQKKSINELRKELALTGDKNLQERHEARKLVEFAQQYFWIIEIWLDKEENGRQPYQINDQFSHPVNFTRPKSVDDCIYNIKNFIKTHQAGGRSEHKVLIKVKAHPEASGQVLDYTDQAIVKCGYERYRVEIIEEPTQRDEAETERETEDVVLQREEDH